MRNLEPPAGLEPAKFLKRHWQRTPLLLRQAVPAPEAVVAPGELMQLACRDDARARLIIRRGRHWEVHDGPFRRRDFSRLPARGWSLLVQEVNHFVPEAERLLRRFAFVPYARLDDLMVSYAPDGGGVGPHFDSYDVFLLQGAGRRRWRISAQEDRELVEGAPLRILRRFRPEQDWLLAPGDMLYLPPRYAHEGIAVGECITYSIGFRAPSDQELVEAFLDHLRDTLRLEGMYRDPDLRRQGAPGLIGARMLDKVQRTMGRVKWTRRELLRFLGRYLTEPKPHVFFTPPAAPLPRAAFLRACTARGVTLDLKSRALHAGRSVFMNGDAHDIEDRTALRLLRRLADARELPAFSPERESAALLYRWYRDGYIAPGDSAP